MIRKAIICAMCSFIFFSSSGVCGKAASFETAVVKNGDIDEISISVNIMPLKDSKFCFSFNTNDEDQINFIVHFLNSISLCDDGKVLSGADIPIIDIQIMRKDGFVDKVGFIDNRFRDTDNRQFAVNNAEEYTRFVNFVYALKTNELKLNNNVTFTPSEWAKASVEQAISNGFVPKWSQINYTGSITRLEVCQLIDNFLQSKGAIKSGNKENPFADTSDKSVIAMYSAGIIHGKTASEFKPYDYITREEFAEILSSAYHVFGSSPAETDYSVTYADQEKISDWAANSVKEVSSLKLFLGNDVGEFRPKNNITKEEAVITLLRLYDLTGSARSN